MSIAVPTDNRSPSASSTPPLLLPRLRPDQKRIAEALEETPVVVLAMGRRWGKTVLGEVLVATFGAMGAHVAWVVPTYKNGRPLWRMLRQVLAPHKQLGLVRINDTERTIEFGEHVGGGFIGMYTGEDNCDAMRGEAFDLVIVDEAAKLSEMAWTDAILPTLADRAGRAMLISTPRGRNWFWQWWTRGQDESQPDVRSFTAPSSENPNPRIQHAAELARDRVPERTYQQEWLAEFVDDGGGVFRNVRACIAGSMLEIAPRGGIGAAHYAIGCDLAKHQDFTVTVVVDMQQRRVVAFDRYNKADWPLQKERIAALSRLWNGATVWQDATGVGDPIYDDLKRMGVPVKPYKLTAASKADLIEHAVLMVEQRGVTFPDCAVTKPLIAELEAFEYQQTPKGNLRMAAPEGMHDDCVIAFALACWPLGHAGSGLTREMVEAAKRPRAAREDGDVGWRGFGGLDLRRREL